MVRIFRSNSTSTHAPPTSDGTPPAPESASKTLPRSASFPMAALKKKAGRMLGLTSPPKAPKIEAPRAESPSASPPRSALRSGAPRSASPAAPGWSSIQPGDKGRLVDLMHKERPSDLTRDTRAAMGRKQVRFVDQAVVSLDKDGPSKLSRLMGSHRRSFSIKLDALKGARGDETPKRESVDPLRTAPDQRLFGINMVVERIEALIKDTTNGRVVKAMVERGEIPYLVKQEEMRTHGLTEADEPDILARYREFNNPEFRGWLDSQPQPNAKAASDAESKSASGAESDAALAAGAGAESLMISDYELESGSDADIHSEAGSEAQTER